MGTGRTILSDGGTPGSLSPNHYSRFGYT